MSKRHKGEGPTDEQEGVDYDHLKFISEYAKKNYWGMARKRFIQDMVIIPDGTKCEMIFIIEEHQWYFHCSTSMDFLGCMVKDLYANTSKLDRALISWV